MKLKVKPRVRRCQTTGDWLAYVLIGEKHHCFGAFSSKRDARKVAREQSALMSAH